MLPKVLIVANDAFSQESSNGRTLGNFFLHYPKDRLAQLYTGDYPLDLVDCAYFHISDQMVLNHLFKHQKPGEIRHFDPASGKAPSEPSLARRVIKNPLTCLERNFAWKTGAWKSKALFEWLDAVKPDIVLLQVGDFPFMFDWARLIAKRENAKMALFSTEDYYFKSWNYIGDENGHKHLYPLLHKEYRKAYEAYIKGSSLCIYNSEMLKDDFCKALPHKATGVVYTPTTWTPMPFKQAKGKFVVSYFGTLGRDRLVPLLAIASALKAQTDNFEFTIYGLGATREEIEAINAGANTHYHTPVSYDEVKKVAQGSDLLVHAESFDPFFERDRRHEFSTKIADCLASGRCLLVYAPDSLAFVQYLISNKAAFVATSSNQLTEELKEILSCSASRTKYFANAKKSVAEYHSIAKNEEKIQELLLDCVNSKN